jgi:cytochrome c oxidase cbb3-type subunit 3
MASFWSMWIIVLTSATIVGLIWILFANRKREQQPDDKTTGHISDGIEEYDNPLPAWWFYMFFITIVWGIGYLIIYPGMGNFPGLLGWTQLEQHQREVSTADKKFRAMRDRYLALPIEEISADPAVRKMGMRMFANNCAQCHGADARGSYGFPDLADGDWLYGGSPADIKASITEGRLGAMPAWGSVIGDQGVTDVTAYILSINGREPDAERAEAGAQVFATYCSTCHGADASGIAALGAPNLKNGIWLYGGTVEQISHSVSAGRSGIMPAHRDALSEDKIHILSAYVYGLNK